MSTPSNECPVCLHAFDTTRRTKVDPFDCTHVICSLCDAEMFARHQDTCPLCRNTRTTRSIHSNGWRAPAPSDDPDFQLGLLAHVAPFRATVVRFPSLRDNIDWFRVRRLRPSDSPSAGAAVNPTRIFFANSGSGRPRAGDMVERASFRIDDAQPIPMWFEDLEFAHAALNAIPEVSTSSLVQMANQRRMSQRGRGPGNETGWSA